MSTDATHPPQVTTPPMRGDDLEAIVVLLELAAIYLTPSPGTLFTKEQLFAQMHEIGGDEIKVNEQDAAIVLRHMKSLKRHAGNRLSLR